ncbi:serine hydrolase domain-containing protein [Dyella mobilis]|uniref:Beta-lactamase family protein n=1 Tax=Dyella mobilis TaxID=1849582 RepID=A0ABS2KJP2_9GAMM|nr:serine hydrolase domain-containing protein [Dyella mobilis]MBM7130628.1 beta-lactamase family protein [Dyella mobilis]
MADAPATSKNVQDAFAASGLPGGCAMSFDGSHVLTQYADGYADAARQKKYGVDTIQPIASVSKTVIGLVLAQLALKKQIDLDAPIDNYLPWKVRNPRFPNTPITLRELATHTSGLVDGPIYDKSYQDGHTPSMSMRDFVRRYTDPRGEWFSAANFSDNEPGAHYEYSNLGADLAAVIIGYKTGEPFSRYASEHVFQPLGMQDTSFAYHQSPRDTALFDGKGKALKPYTEVTYADGSMHTTCRDVTKYLQAVLRARAGESSPLDAAVVAMALAPQYQPGKLPSGLKHPNQGLFWSYNELVAGVGHNGSDPGVTSYAYVSLHGDRGFVFIANSSVEDNPAYGKGIMAIWKAWSPLQQ